MKNWIIYIVLNLIEGLANLAATVSSAIIVIALYKTTKTMQVEDLINALYVLQRQEVVVTMSVTLMVAICVRAVCEKLKRKFEE